MKNLDIKKALLGLAAAGLFLLSNIVESKRCEDDIREMVKEEVKNFEKKRNKEV